MSSFPANTNRRNAALSKFALSSLGESSCMVVDRFFFWCFVNAVDFIQKCNIIVSCRERIACCSDLLLVILDIW